MNYELGMCQSPNQSIESTNKTKQHKTKQNPLDIILLQPATDASKSTHTPTRARRRSY
eukprot:jgi/Psemu1/306999/fgenesh1_kg.296_\